MSVGLCLRSNISPTSSRRLKIYVSDYVHLTWELNVLNLTFFHLIGTVPLGNTYVVAADAIIPEPKIGVVSDLWSVIRARLGGND